MCVFEIGEGKQKKRTHNQNPNRSFDAETFTPGHQIAYSWSIQRQLRNQHHCIHDPLFPTIAHPNPFQRLSTLSSLQCILLLFFLFLLQYFTI